MTGFIGMDIQAVRGLAQQLNQKAEEIDQIAGTLSQQLEGTQWVGPDASNFRSNWNGTHQAQLKQVSNALREASTSASNNASQQEQASS